MAGKISCGLPSWRAAMAPTNTPTGAFSTALSPLFAHGDIRRSWAAPSHAMTGMRIVKLSLQTGDHATASTFMVFVKLPASALSYGLSRRIASRDRSGGCTPDEAVAPRSRRRARPGVEDH